MSDGSFKRIKSRIKPPWAIYDRHEGQIHTNNALKQAMPGHGSIYLWR